MQLAILSRASSINTRDCLPSSWELDGLPKSLRCSIIAFLAASHTGVVAAQSK